MPLSIGRPGSASPPRLERPPSPERWHPNSAGGLHPSVAGPSDVHSAAATAAPQQPLAGRCSLPGPDSAADRDTARWAPPGQPVAPELESATGPIPGPRKPLLAPAPEPSTEMEFQT